MPPNVKITKEDIIKNALELIREEGGAALNARSIAARLGCSTQPIFSNFETMERLEEAVIAAAYQRYEGYLSREAESGKYPAYKAMGMAYIRFAKEEKELFKLLFMCDRSGEELPTTDDFKTSVEIIKKNNGVSEELATLIHLEGWACVHGIATMLATSFLTFEWELIENMLTDVYQGVRLRYASWEN